MIGLIALDSQMKSTKQGACATACQQRAQWCAQQSFSAMAACKAGTVATASNGKDIASSIVQPVYLRVKSLKF